jgi:hypothetical protein
VRRAALFEIIEHHIRRAHEFLIAAHVIGAPDEIPRIALRHIAHRCPLISPEGEDSCDGLTERWASVICREWRKASLHWACR